jgi:hypothetical protein
MVVKNAVLFWGIVHGRRGQMIICPNGAEI